MLNVIGNFTQKPPRPVSIVHECQIQCPDGLASVKNLIGRLLFHHRVRNPAPKRHQFRLPGWFRRFLSGVHEPDGIAAAKTNRTVCGWQGGSAVDGFFPQHPLSECDERFVDDNDLVPSR